MASAKGFRKCTVCALGALSLVAVTPGSAVENQPRMDLFDGQWHFSVTPYAWLPTIYNTTTLNPFGISNGVTSKLHSTPDTYLHNLSFAFFLAGEARKGDWSLFADYLYMKFDHQKSGLKPIDRPGAAGTLPFDSSSGIQANVLTLAGSYSVWRKGASHLDVFAGTRYLNLVTTLDYSLFLFPGHLNASVSVNKWDGIVGVKGRIGLSEDGRWFMPYYLDAGVGSQNTTWQALVGTGYRYGWGDVTVILRNLSYNFDGKGHGGLDARFTGLGVGATFFF